MRMRLYALGSNGSHQLGLGHADDLSTPSLVPLPSELNSIVHIACGGNHTLLQTGTGKVFAAGDNSSGQCGLSDDTLPAFRDIGLANVKFCATTWEASIFVTEQGEILVCGAGGKGELGLGPGITKVSTPTLVWQTSPEGPFVENVAASMGHVVVVLSDGSVIGWGAGRQGQLGTLAENTWAPRQISVPFKAERAACGKDFTCIFSTSGSSIDGPIQAMFGPKRDPHQLTQSALSAESWTNIQANWGGLLIHTPNGSLVGYGRNNHGQYPPGSLPLVEQSATGSEHTLAITRDSRVIAWGWGEHGNCGLPIEQAPNSFNELNADGRPIKVFGGCATSWIVTE